MFEQVKTC